MQQHIDFLMQHLVTEGFRAELDGDGDILFKCEGLRYALCFDASDAAFGKLILANVWQIDSAAELQLALTELNILNRRLKVVKGHTQGDQVWFTVELLLDRQAGWATYLQRCVRGLSHAMGLFAERMRDGTRAQLAGAGQTIN